MTTITLEVPDELATQLNSVGNHLPALLYETLKSRAGEKTAGLLKSGASHPAYREMFDFLRSGPTPAEIIAHRPAAELQDRVARLLEQNREEGLTNEEEAELDGYEQVDDLMSLLKARARSMKP